MERSTALEPPDVEVNETPEVQINGNEAIILIRKRDTAPEERTVKLPDATWA